MSKNDEKGWLSVKYNRLPLGGVISVPRPSNITLFKKSLEAQGLKEKEDFTARSQGNNCIIRRLTLTSMK